MGDASGAGGQSELPGSPAGGGALPAVFSAHYRGRAVDVAVVRAAAAGWPGSGARDLGEEAAAQGHFQISLV